MARIDGVLNNFLHHVTGGLSGFITGAYDASERAQKPVLLMRLLPEVEFEKEFARDEELAMRAQALQGKFLEILRAASQAPGDRVVGLMVEVDFAWDPVGAEQRRRELAAVPVYYGYDPVYRCTVSIRLASGEEHTRTLRSP